MIGKAEHIEQPSAEEIRAELARITASKCFRAKPQKTKFLRYIVSATLAGTAEQLKGYTIGVEALGRATSFDPQTDPIVRVEAGRLRTALACYYAQEGAADPLLIELPHSGYAPMFRRRTAPLRSSWRTIVARSFGASASRRRKLKVVSYSLLCVAGLLGVMELLFDIDNWRHGGPNNGLYNVWTLARAPPPAAPPVRLDSPYPMVAIERFESVGTPPPQGGLRRLEEKLRDALSHFDEIQVNSAIAPIDADLNRTRSIGAPVRPRAGYQLEATIEYRADGAASPTFRLVDLGNHTQVWSLTYIGVPAVERPAAIEDEIAGIVAASLAELNGVIQSRERARRAASEPVDWRYSCLLDAIDYWRRDKPADATAVRSCLEAATAADASFAPGFSYLALLELDRYYGDTTGGSQSVSTLDRALRYAQRAIELRLQSARAHIVLMRIHSVRGDIAAAKRAGQQARTLNPHDRLIEAEYGYRLITFGEVETGLEILRRRATGSDVRPVWFSFGLCLGSYLLDRLPDAVMYCDSNNSNSRWSLALRATVAAKAGDQARAPALIQQLVQQCPEMFENPKREFAKIIADRDIVERLSADLTDLADLRPRAGN